MKLKLQVETVVDVSAWLEPRAEIYLYGSMARKILGIIKEGRKKFDGFDSDADLMIFVPAKPYPRRLWEKLQEELSSRIRERQVDICLTLSPVVDTFGVLGIGNEERILLYQKGKFNFPWREPGFNPSLLTLTVSVAE